MRPTLIYIQLDQVMEHLGTAIIPRLPLSGVLMAGWTALTSAMWPGSLPMEDESKLGSPEACLKTGNRSLSVEWVPYSLDFFP